MEDRVQTGESSSLLQSKKAPSLGTGSRLLMRYNATHKCVWSKSALLILVWSFVISLISAVVLDPNVYMTSLTIVYTLGGYLFTAIVLCCYPLAGFLADTKYGRYKTVVRSLVLLSITIVVSLVIGGLCIVGLVLSQQSDSNAAEIIGIVVLAIVSIVGSVSAVLVIIGQTCFTANVIQFGMDQLHDSPGEDRTLFIHWYVWLLYLGIMIGQLAWNLGFQIAYEERYFYRIIGYGLDGLIALTIVLVLPITLCLVRRWRTWFLIEPGMYNSYRLVYRVTKFAQQHRAPLNRSAFTYDEEDIPTGLDLAKDKYGGPFATEQVQDVKVFYGILTVLLSFGAVFFLDFAASSVLPMNALHITPYLLYSDRGLPIYNGTLAEHIMLNSSLLSPLLVVLCLPVYLCLLHPFISHRVPSMLKRMGLSIALVLLSLIASFSLDTAAHEQHSVNSCMFNFFYSSSPLQSGPSPYYLVIQLTLSALSHMLIYTAVFEFICAQAPHSMKGLLIGLLYAIKGLYQLLATLLVVPIVGVDSANILFPISCGFYYYLFNIAVGVLTLIVFIWVARRYKYRERDEPSNVYRYAEEYYSNPQQEQYYDYD